MRAEQVDDGMRPHPCLQGCMKEEDCICRHHATYNGVNVADSNQACIIFQETHLGLRSSLTSTAAAIHNIQDHNSSSTVSSKAQVQATDYTSTVTGL